MQVQRLWRDRLRPPPFLGQPNPMFSGDRATRGKNETEKIVQSSFHLLTDRRASRIRNHHVHMNVAVTGVSKTGYRKSVFELQIAGKFHEVDQLSSRHSDIFVQFGEPRGL